MSVLMNTLAGVLAGAAAFTLTFADLNKLYLEAHTAVVQVESYRDWSTVNLAKLQYHADRHTGDPSVEELVSLGYLDASFLSRPRVGAPVELPAVPEEALKSSTYDTPSQ